jgi:hypothetical protein
VDCKIILQRILGKQGAKTWTRCIRLRIRTSGGLLRTRQSAPQIVTEGIVNKEPQYVGLKSAHFEDLGEISETRDKVKLII